jgi:mitochondrial fission protein ELM1
MRQVGFSPAVPLKVWAVTDGRAGIENQALGLAEALARRVPAEITVKRIQLRSPYSWFPPGFVPFARTALTDHSDAVAPPWPDVWIGCGRASVPLSMGVRGWSRGRTLVVQLQDPLVNPREFDLVVPPTHDDLVGANIIPTLGTCHRITPETIEQATADYPTPLDDLPSPRYAIVIGGKSKRGDITAARAQAISEQLARLSRTTGGALMATLSRRTAEPARIQFRARLAPHCALFYEGEGANPYFAMLGAADAIIVTADSVSMIAEAASTGKPIHILDVDGSTKRHEPFHQALFDRGIARPFKLPLAHWTYTPLAEADRVAAIVLGVLQKRMAG